MRTKTVSAKMATCHPDRPHKARGYCNYCYVKNVYCSDPVKKAKHKARIKEGIKRWSARPENANKPAEYRERRKKKLKENPEIRFFQDLKYKYGLTPEKWFELVQSRNFACWICGEIPEEYLCVDHCHETGRVRGMLCMSCNTGLGQFKNSVERLEKAKKYLLS